MSRTIRLRKSLVEYLNGDIQDAWIEKGVRPREPGPANTQELLVFYNISTRHGTTTHQLGNVLSKDSNIVKVGTIRTGRSMVSGGYDICVWATHDYVRSQIPEFERGDLVIFDETTQTLERLVKEN